MELKITPSPDGFVKTIEFNHDEIKAEIAEKVAYYKTLVYTDAQIKDAKADRAELNKLVKTLEDKRKEIKALCLAPYDRFEKQMKELVAIVNEPIGIIDEQVKAYEAQQKETKRAEIAAFFDTLDFNGITLEQVFDPKWLNATASMTGIQDALTKRAQEIAVDMKTLADLPEYGFEALEMYKTTVDIRQALNEANRLAELAKKKAEATAPPVIDVPKAEPVVVDDTPQADFIPDFDEIVDNRVSAMFKVKATAEEIDAIEQFLKVNKVDYERIG